jgi:hypothetical protein
MAVTNDSGAQLQLIRARSINPAQTSNRSSSLSVLAPRLPFFFCYKVVDVQGQTDRLTLKRGIDRCCSDWIREEAVAVAAAAAVVVAAAAAQDEDEDEVNLVLGSRCTTG